MSRKLYRSNSDKIIAGVCGGLGEFLNIDPVLIRLAFVLATVFGGAGFVIYVAMWLLIPAEGESSTHAEDLAAEVRSRVDNSGEEMKTEHHSEVVLARRGYHGSTSRQIIGVVLIALGGIFLADYFMPGFNPVIVWGSLFILIGLVLVLRGPRR